MARTLTLQIKRRKPAAPAHSVSQDWQDYQVSIPANAYVLDALEAARLQDPSLLFRHSCHHASCGSCGLRIQGRERLACITPAFEAAKQGRLRLEPLRNFPVLADLVVDLSSMAHQLEEVGAHLLTERMEGWQRFGNCIECGLCISACPISATSDSYLGPAVIAAASRNIEAVDIRARVAGENGVWRCHSAFECTAVCPANVDPASSIMNLRRRLMLSMLKRKGQPHA